MWKWKMVSSVTTSVPEMVVCERAVNAEEFSTIGVTQKFEGLGWERVLDWCEDITSRVYLAAVCEWLSTLRFVNMDGPAPTRQLVGNIGKNQMVMSFEHMNAIARFDSLGVETYDYYDLDHFLDNKMYTADPDGMLAAVLPGLGGMSESRNDLSLEERILQGISLENVMVQFGDRGRESCTRKMIPYVRLLSALILQQNALPAKSLWVSKPIDQICFASMKHHWKITVKVFGHLYTVEDEQGNSYRFSDPSMAQGGAQDEEMVDEEDETEPAGPRGPKQRYMRQHRELSEDVARFVTCRWVPSYQNINRG
ncbi:hypothetical protein HanRHA438_Chr05g0233241 [Helianthus annuus]|uniref:Uncharacterized protein n=1 Tax=Helianthus annuus TaxID=4232 RepID=A0A9K3NPG9_HELAN|nr:hypothetical protein HanXRQr2_Chr05g0224211 [Helianthus annuus]KAJ0585254.1 hypothetical protein HanHA89_Chr05g0198271 [Helianthus annuus]KAJ0919747.1 hypothetical protein HanRHA438_Chr05g0233241 [Helianthus annuus]